MTRRAATSANNATDANDRKRAKARSTDGPQNASWTPPRPGGRTWPRAGHDQNLPKTFDTARAHRMPPPARPLRGDLTMRTLYVFPFILLASACTVSTTNPSSSAKDPVNDPEEAASVQSALEQ